MEILNIHKYENHLKYYDYISNDIETLCKNEKYSLFFYPVDRNDPDYHMVEYLRIPSFVDAFYHSIDNRYSNKKLLNQKEFWAYYKKVYKKFFSKDGLTDNILQKIEGRIFRAYPSLVRDIHFLLFLKEKFGAENTLYNPKLDSEIGVDVMLNINGKYYGIKLLASTERSEKFKEIKDKFRQKSFSNVEFIVIPKQLDGIQCGDFFLYGEKEYNNFIAPLLK